MKRYAPWVLAAVLLSLLMLGRSGATLPVAALGLAVATLLYLVGSRWHLFHRLARSRVVVAVRRTGGRWLERAVPPGVRSRALWLIDVLYLPVFWTQMSLVTVWLLLGLSTAIVAQSPELHERFHELGTGQGLIAEMMQNIALASHSASSLIQTTIDYAFSILNLTLAIFLVRHDSKQPAARLLAVGMGSTAVAFNLQAHSALLVIPQSWFAAVDLWHTLAIHTAAGIAYVFALLLFPDGRFVARRRLPYLFLIVLLYGGVAAMTAEDHIVGLVLLFGVITPLAGLTAQARRFRRATKPVARQQSRLILVALTMALVSAIAVAAITVALSSTNQEFTQTTKAYSFTAPPVGTYGFVCDPHTDDMVGEVRVRPRRPGEDAIFRTELVAEDSRFDRSLIELPAGSEVILEFTNKDGDEHNVSLYGGLFAAGPPAPGEDPLFADRPDPIFVGELFPGGDLADLLFRVFRAVFIVLPIALFVGILKLRLWDIDRLMNRALVYALLSGLLGTVYLVSVFAIGALIGAITHAARPPLVVAISTLAVAALFRPARRAIQRFIDRRFYRARYDAARTLEGFSDRMRDRIELDSLSDDLIGVVIQTMQPAHASLWLRGRASAPSGPSAAEDGKDAMDGGSVTIRRR